MDSIISSIVSSILGGMASKVGEKVVDYLTSSLPKRELEQIVTGYRKGVSHEAVATALVDALIDHLGTNPNEHLGWTILGHALEDLNRDAEAKRAYARALQIKPDTFQALVGMGVLLRKEGKYTDAMACYRRATEIDPAYAPAWSSMTVIALKQANDSLALEYALKGYSLDPNDAVITANLAVAYHYKGNYPMRDQMTREALRLGYKRGDQLQAIFRGELTVRDS